MQKEIKKKSWAFAVVAVLLASTLSAVIYFGVVPSDSLKTFSSYSELNSFIASNTPRGYLASFSGPLDKQFSNGNNPVDGSAPTTIPTAIPEAATSGMNDFGFSSFSDRPSYSSTNIQVAGVDEADTVKTDGYYIYLLSTSNSTVYIMDANPQNPEILSKITFNNSSLAGIYLSQNGTKLAVLGSKYTLVTETHTYTVGGVQKSYTSTFYQPQDTKTFVEVYDVSNKTNPVLTRDFSASGSYFNSRMVGDYVYVVVSQAVETNDGTVTLPSVYNGDNCSNIQPTQIYYVDKEDNFYNYFTFTSIIAVNMNDDSQTTSNLTVMMGGANNIYASTNNMYLAYPSSTTYSLTGGRSQSTTEIHRIKLHENTISFDAKGSVPGDILNQYSMDEYQGYFRVATTLWQDGKQQNNVYVLDMDLAVVGKLENLASGENMHSARFMGDKCYLVTFQKIDPLFVIDLSQPANPNVLGELKIPGYSDYLHPYDETHIIGVGKDTVAADSGNFAWYQGLKLSLFDVSNVNDPQQVANVVIGDRGTDSPVLSDPKAFLFDKSKNLLVIPVNLAVIDGTNQITKTSSYGTLVWQGAYVYKLTLEGGFELQGTVTQIDAQTNPQNERGSWITRTLYIDNTLYTVSDQKVQLNSLQDMAFIAQVQLQ
jgi:inhibitor of cysteine peptidase